MDPVLDLPTVNGAGAAAEVVVNAALVVPGAAVVLVAAVVSQRPLWSTG